MTRVLRTRRSTAVRALDRAIGRRVGPAADPRGRADAGELHDGRARRPRHGRRPARVVLLHRERRAGAHWPAIYREAAGRAARSIPRRAALMRFDAYVASDFMWATLPRGTCRIQMFHGVGGKYGFDAPTASMREWDRLFFVNERRLRNFVAAGAIDADSPAIRLIGMPKADCLVDGSSTARAVLAVARPRSVAADGALRADVVARIVAQRDGRRCSSRGLLRCRRQPDRQAARPIARPARALLGRRRLGGAARSRCLAPGRGVIAPGHDISRTSSRPT